MPRRFGWMLIFYLASLVGLFADGETVTVRRIKLEMGGEQFVWEDQVPDGGGHTAFRPRTVFSYTAITPGEEWDLAELEAEARRTEARLLASGLFYSARVNIVPPRRFPEYRTLYIAVEPGFLYRFGGGLAYGSAGRWGIGGRRNFAALTLGANLNRIDYIDEDLFNADWILETGIEYRNHLLSGDDPWHRFQTEAALGYRFLPDAVVGIDGRLCFQEGVSGRVGPYFEYRLPRTDFFSACFRVEVPVEFGNEIKPTFYGFASVREDLGRFYLNQKGGVQLFSGAPSRLGSYSRTSSLPLEGWAAAEAGWNLFNQTFFSLFDTGLDLFAFGEAGWSNRGSLMPDFSWGGGIKLVFRQPVFVTVEAFYTSAAGEGVPIRIQISGN